MIPWTVAHQAPPPFFEISKKTYICHTSGSSFFLPLGPPQIPCLDIKQLLLRPLFSECDPTVPTSQTLETPRWLPGVSEMLCFEWRGWKAWCPCQGTPGRQHTAGRPRPGAARGSTDLRLGLERRAGAPCGQDRLGHCLPAARPRIIVTFDLAGSPLAGLGGRARAGGQGPCPEAPDQVSE